ncbi:type IV pilus biogenesis protein PilM [Telmatospirillum sp.]|uniref:type IV pilus biogenesis protein PilM n=1 Tax=Telmatospirillum sp. TaxID=2079197 RepID=UPI00283D2651|nr:hypothetical protein [Telmatospirillum sp.]MDR3438187.1 hypothetical protein [Telmatospirillum sp.]
MAALLMIGSFLAVIGYYLFLLPPITQQARDALPAEVVAGAMLVYQKAAVDWCLRTSCPDGPVPVAELIFPPGYGSATWLRATVTAGLVTTFVTTGVRVDSLSIAGALGDVTTGGPGAGLSTSASTVSARDFLFASRVPVPIAAGVPAGVPVVSQKVR